MHFILFIYRFLSLSLSLPVSLYLCFSFSLIFLCTMWTIFVSQHKLHRFYRSSSRSFEQRKREIKCKKNNTFKCFKAEVNAVAHMSRSIHWNRIKNPHTQTWWNGSSQKNSFFLYFSFFIIIISLVQQQWLISERSTSNEYLWRCYSRIHMNVMLRLLLPLPLLYVLRYVCTSCFGWP